LTDPRDRTEATDDERRAANAAAEVRIHHTGDSNSAIPEEHVTEPPVPDPRDLSRATDDEARAAAAAKRERVDALEARLQQVEAMVERLASNVAPTEPE